MPEATRAPESPRQAERPAEGAEERTEPLVASERPRDRYALFAGVTYKALGGWFDLAGTFATVEEAKAWFDSRRDADFDGLDWGHIVDLDEADVVASRFPSSVLPAMREWGKWQEA